ncbi:MAG: F0F1 ATP synthase subunit B, partial [Ignavibacteriaceae bacterium]
VQDSKEQAKKIVDDASKEIESKKEAAFEELKNQVAEIAVQAAEKIMRENLDGEAQKKIANKFIGEITKN